VLLKVATQASVEMGVSVTKAFNDITTGVGRASPLILDNLGIIVDSVKVYDAYAVSIGTTVTALTKQQRTLALTKAVVDQASVATEDFTEIQNELTASINKSEAALKNLTQATGNVGGGLLQMAAGGLTAVAIILSVVQEGVLKVVKSFVALARLIPGINGAWKGLAESLQEFDDEMDVSQKKMAQLALDLSKGGFATVALATGFKEITSKAKLAAPAIEDVSEAAEKTAEAVDEANDELEDMGEALDVVNIRATTTNRTLEKQAVVVATTAREWSRLVDEMGKAAAVQEVLNRGGKLTQGGTRVQLPGHGSRLVDSPGIRSNNYGLSEFGTGGRVKVNTNGTLRPD